MSRVIKSYRVIESDRSNISKESDEIKKSIESKSIEEVKLAAKQRLEKLESEAEKTKEKAREEYNKLINQAKLEKKDILEKARQESNDLKENSRLEGYEKGFQEGREVGYNEGYSEGKTEADKIIQEANELKRNNNMEFKDRLSSLESKIIEMVIEIYEKVIGKTLAEDEDYVLDLVYKGLRNLDPTDNLTIITSKKDYEILSKNKDKILAHASLINNLEIKYDINFVKGDCLLETEKGNIDISVKDQLKEVKDLLNKILNNE